MFDVTASLLLSEFPALTDDQTGILPIRTHCNQYHLRIERLLPCCDPRNINSAGMSLLLRLVHSMLVRHEAFALPRPVSDLAAMDQSRNARCS